jgi:hypothetical protein
MYHDLSRRARLYDALARLLAIEANGLQHAESRASGIVMVALGADLVDLFLYEALTDHLVALGTPASALGRKQAACGFDRRSTFSSSNWRLATSA